MVTQEDLENSLGQSSYSVRALLRKETGFIVIDILFKAVTGRALHSPFKKPCIFPLLKSPNR